MSLTYSDAAIQLGREIIDSEPELFRRMTPEETAAYNTRMATVDTKIVALITTEIEPS